MNEALHYLWIGFCFGIGFAIGTALGNGLLGLFKR